MSFVSEFAGLSFSVATLLCILCQLHAHLAHAGCVVIVCVVVHCITEAGLDLQNKPLKVRLWGVFPP